jgi:hypothetical protein
MPSPRRTSALAAATTAPAAATVMASAATRLATRLSAARGPWLFARRYAATSPAAATIRERDAALARPDLKGRAQGGESRGLRRVGPRRLTSLSFVERRWDEFILRGRSGAPKSNRSQSSVVHLHPLVRFVTPRCPAVTGRLSRRRIALSTTPLNRPPPRWVRVAPLRTSLSARPVGGRPDVGRPHHEAGALAVAPPPTGRSRDGIVRPVPFGAQDGTSGRVAL